MRRRDRTEAAAKDLVEARNCLANMLATHLDMAMSADESGLELAALDRSPEVRQALGAYTLVTAIIRAHGLDH